MNNDEFYGQAKWETILKTLLRHPKINQYLKNEESFYKRTIENDKPTTVLDVGCGTGRVLASLKESQVKGFGIDIAHEAINYCKKKLPEYNFVQGDSREIPFFQDSFDTILLPYSFLGNISQEDRDRTLEEIFRTIKPNGKILFSTYSPDAKKAQEEAYGLIPENSDIHSNDSFTYVKHNGVQFQSQRFDPKELENLVSQYPLSDFRCEQGPIYNLCSAKVRK